MPRHKDADVEDQSFSLRFGGGVNTRKSPLDIESNECVEGKNFDIDIDRQSLTRRPNITQFATLPVGAGPLDGYAMLERGGDPSLSAGPLNMFQCGTEIYFNYYNTFTSEWETNLTTFTVAAGARLRGTIESTTDLTLDGSVYVIITDLSLLEPVKRLIVTSAGVTTLEDFPHNIADTDFYAKYCFIENERAWFSNIRTDDGTDDVTVPHMIVASETEVLTNITVANRPSSSLGESDPFYLLTPDLKPVNGITAALGSVLLSSLAGRIFILNGSSSQDFYFDTLYAGSGASDEEAFSFAGNDVAYMANGVLESLAGVQAFGDVENDDLSRQIQKELTHFATQGQGTGAAGSVGDLQSRPYSVHYDQRLKMVFVYRTGDKFFWTFKKSIHDQQAKDVSLLRQGTPVSPWVKWDTVENAGEFNGLFSLDTTSDPEAYSDHPVLMWSSIHIDPAAGTIGPGNFDYNFSVLGNKKSTFFAGPGRTIFRIDYQFDNTGSYTPSKTLARQPNWAGGTDALEPDSDTDGLSERIVCSRKSKIISAPSGESISEVTGVVTYIPRYHIEPELDITIYFQGKRSRTATKTVILKNRTKTLGASLSEAEVNSATRSISFSFQGRQATQMQIELSWEDYLVEILSVDFNVRA